MPLFIPKKYDVMGSIFPKTSYANQSNYSSFNSVNVTPIYADDVIINSPVLLYTLVALQLVAILAAIGGNTFLIIMIVRSWKRARRQVTAYFILNLAVCDLFSAAVHQPMRLVDIIFDDGIVNDAKLYCQVTSFIAGLIRGVAFHSITCISIERYVLVCFPMKARSWLTIFRAKLMLGAIWLLACVCMIPLPLLFSCVVNLRLNDERNSSFCLINIMSDSRDAQVYFYTIFSLYYLIPLVTITFCYSKVFHVLHKGAAMITRTDVNSLRMLRTRKAVAKVMLCIAILFILCESPYFLTFFYRSLGNKIQNNPVTILLVIEALPLICAVANPIVYGSHSCCNRRRFATFIGGRAEMTRADTYRSEVTISGSLKGTPSLMRPQLVVRWCNGVHNNNHSSSTAM